MSGINPQIFRPEELSFPSAVPAETQDQPQQPDVPVGSLSTGEASAKGAALQQSADRFLQPNWIESLGAGMLDSEAMNAYRFVTKPAFAEEANPPRFEMMQQLPFVMSREEEEVWNKAKSADELRWYADRFTERRERTSVAAIHPSAMFMANVVDPAYLTTGPIIGGLAKTMKTAGAARAFGAAAQGATAATVAGLASEVNPMSTSEYAAAVLLNMAGGMVIAKEGKLAKLDDAFPEKELEASLQAFRRDFVGPAPHGVGEKVVVPVSGKPHISVPGAERNTVRFAKENPDEILKPGADAVDPTVVNAAVVAKVGEHTRSWSEQFGEKIMWNLNKSFHKTGAKGGEVGDLLVDNNMNLSQTSAESVKRGVQAEMVNLQHAYEDVLRETMAEQGHGTFSLLLSRPKTVAAQAKIEADLMQELLRRQAAHAAGTPIKDPNIAKHITRLADAHDAATAHAAKLLKQGGVHGADQLEAMPGYFSRVWSSMKIDDLTNAFKSAGLDATAAHQQVVRLVQKGLQKKNPDWAEPLSYDVAASIVNRTLRKGYLTDGPAGAQVNAGTLAQLRDELRNIGVRPENMDRVLEVVAGKVDESGKLPFLKHRMELDFTASTTVNGRTVRLSDLLESNISTIMDRYIDKASGRIALAQKGLKTPGDIAKMREELMQSLPSKEARTQAAALFDNTVDRLLGNPVGDAMNQTLRNGQAVGRMMALGGSGAWQLTEYATPMAKYGIAKTFKYAMAEMPIFRTLMETAAKDKATSMHLKDVLTNAATQNFRIRPYIQRFEDNFDMPGHSRTTMALQQGTQLVPYVNGMKFVHTHQARITSNLILDTLKRAANGSTKHREMLGKYGVELGVMDNLAAQFKQHGFAVDKWDDAVWMQTRPAFIKMMDEAVLHQRMGDIPAFAQFDQVGKFIFTYRSFILSAHNKLLAGTMARDGMAATTLMMMYQFPLAVMATQANSVASGKGVLDQEKLIKKSIGQMGSIGLFSELYGWLSGNKSEVGAPGLIPYDRMIKAGQSAFRAASGEGETSKAISDTMNVMPIIAITPGVRALQHLGE